MYIIGISGKLGSGKGTITKRLIELNSNFKERFFAEKLKKFVCDLCGIDYELSLTQEGKNTYIETFGMTLGELLQDIGTKLRDTVDVDIWIKSIFTTMNNEGLYLISDLRFINECEYINKYNGVTLRVNRSNNTIGKKSKRDLNHKSETELDNYIFDYVIENNGTYDEFISKIDGFYYNYYVPIFLKNIN